MKLPAAIALIPFLLAVSTAADAACVYPQAPQKMPNGAQATKDEMLAAQAEIKAYRAAVEETYLPCLDQEKAESIAALDNMDPEYTEKKAAIESMQAKKHNAALDELTATAARWSEELKAFSAASK